MKNLDSLVCRCEELKVKYSFVANKNAIMILANNKEKLSKYLQEADDILYPLVEELEELAKSLANQNSLLELQIECLEKCKQKIPCVKILQAEYLKGYERNITNFVLSYKDFVSAREKVYINGKAVICQEESHKIGEVKRYFEKLMKNEFIQQSQAWQIPNNLLEIELQLNGSRKLRDKNDKIIDTCSTCKSEICTHIFDLSSSIPDDIMPEIKDKITQLNNSVNLQQPLLNCSRIITYKEDKWVIRMIAKELNKEEIAKLETEEILAEKEFMERAAIETVALETVRIAVEREAGARAAKEIFALEETRLAAEIDTSILYEESISAEIELAIREEASITAEVDVIRSKEERIATEIEAVERTIRELAALEGAILAAWIEAARLEEERVLAEIEAAECAAREEEARKDAAIAAVACGNPIVTEYLNRTNTNKEQIVNDEKRREQIMEDILRNNPIAFSEAIALEPRDSAIRKAGFIAKMNVGAC